jgi:hypothetical protein
MAKAEQPLVHWVNNVLKQIGSVGQMRRWIKYLTLAITLLAANVVVGGLLVYTAGTFLDTSLEFNENMWQWRRMGQYPFPGWLLWLVPRLAIWPVSAEVAYQLSQAIVWGCNGYLVRRYAPVMRPVLWVWVPIVLETFVRDPLQVVLGSAGFWMTARGGRPAGKPARPPDL